MELALRPPTDRLAALSWTAATARIAASALRCLAACAVGFAGLLALALFLATFERDAGVEPFETSASAYLDFDLSVLRELASRSLRPETSPQAHRDLSAAWSRRPDWQLPDVQEGPVRFTSIRDAWTAVASEKSRFRTAARGAADALPMLLAALAIGFCGAAIAGVLTHVLRLPANLRRAGLGRVAFAAGVYVLVLHPLWPLLDPAVFYDRTRSLGSIFSAVFFVAAFAGTLSGAAARALLAPESPAQHLAALRGRPALTTAARISALGAAEWLLPLVPALAAAALFVCAKADQDPTARASASGLGALVRAAMRELSVAERLSSCALVGGSLLVLSFVGHRFVIEVREALGKSRVEP